MTTVYRIAQLLGRPQVRKLVVIALWLAAVAASAVRVWVMLRHPILPGEHYRISGDRYFGDFRDTVWTPGRFLLRGGNPYDPGTYLAANPWALPFSLYTPAWLLLAGVLAPLPYLVSVAVYQVLSLGVAVVMLRVICRWSLPTIADIAVPAGLLWMNIWYPGRGALSTQVGSVFAVLGIALVLRSLARPAPPSSGPADVQAPRPRSVIDRACAVGVALALVKAQFGAAVVVGFGFGRFREVWWGLVGLTLLSMPALILCAVAAGGPIEFARSVLRDLAVLNSNASPTGLAYPGQLRFDIIGQLARYGLVNPPLWLQAGVPLLAFAAALVAVRLTRDPLLVSAVVCTSILIGFYHSRYDLLLLFIPIAVGAGMVVRGELTSTAQRITVGALVLVVLHLHTVSAALIPGFDVRAGDTVDLVLVVIGLVGAMYSVLSTQRRSSGVDVMPKQPLVS
ncbi:MAG: hypothetical protein ACRDRS_00315 [Pseudonocardiaceae bacterium]